MYTIHTHAPPQAQSTNPMKSKTWTKCISLLHFKHKMLHCKLHWFPRDFFQCTPRWAFWGHIGQISVLPITKHGQMWVPWENHLLKTFVQCISDNHLSTRSITAKCYGRAVVWTVRCHCKLHTTCSAITRSTLIFAINSAMWCTVPLSREHTYCCGLALFFFLHLVNTIQYSYKQSETDSINFGSTPSQKWNALAATAAAAIHWSDIWFL